MALKNWCSIHAWWSKSSLKHFIHFCVNFSKFKTGFYCISFFSVTDCIFEIHQLWQSGFSRMYSNCCCSCSFKAEIIKIGNSSHKMYSNNILNFQDSTSILNAYTKKKSWNLLYAPRIDGFVDYLELQVRIYEDVNSSWCLALFQPNQNVLFYRPTSFFFSWVFEKNT